MKKFFEQYGGVALGILAVLVLIAMITPVGNIIKTSLQGTATKFSSSMNGQLDDAMNATATVQNDVLGIVDISNINTALASGDFSTKGNLVTINGTQYRVLDVNGTQVKVMSMVNIGDSAFNGSSATTSFGSYTGQKYADSNLDQVMINYYNGLPEAIKTAIVPQTINQSMYSFLWSVPTGSVATSIASDNDDYIVEKKGEVNVGNREVYALDMDDILSYLGSNFTWRQLNKMVFNTENKVSGFVWLRSADSYYSFNAFGVSGNYGYLLRSNYYCSSEVRPAFVLDLSLLAE